MKNNGGWGLTAMILLCGIICFALIISAIVYERSFDRDLLPNIENPSTPAITESYKRMEELLLEGARKYVDKYYPNMPFGDQVYVSVKQLQVEKMLEVLKDTSNNLCTGYVSFERTEDGMNYKPYLKCATKYQTSGYNKTFDK